MDSGSSTGDLEKQRFWWPGAGENVAIEISTRELSWLLEGLDITRVEAHKVSKIYPVLKPYFAARSVPIWYNFAHGFNGFSPSQ